MMILLIEISDLNPTSYLKSMLKKLKVKISAEKFGINNFAFKSFIKK